MMRIEWAEFAESDLDAIVWYIANDSVSHALEADARIRERVRLLAEFPEMGRKGRFAGTRELVLPHDSCVAVYRVSDGAVQVLRLIHGGQMWPVDL